MSVFAPTPTCAYCGNAADYEAEVTDLPTSLSASLYVCERHMERVVARAAAYVARVGKDQVTLDGLLRAVGMQQRGGAS